MDVRRRRDESVAPEYKRKLAASLDEPNVFDDPEKLWTDFKTEVLKVWVSCLRDTPGTSKSFPTNETQWRDSLRRNPAHQIIFFEIRGAGTCRGGRPHASWMRQVEFYSKDTGMAGLASAWAMARGRPNEYRPKVDAATRCSGV